MNRLQTPDCYQILEQTQQAPPVMKQLDLIPLKLLMAGPRRAERVLLNQNNTIFSLFE